MFKRKSSLLKKVWRLKISEHDQQALHNILKNMDENQLTVLYKTLQLKGGADTPCLSGAKCRKINTIDQKLIISRSFCYPDLQSITQLKQLNYCQQKTETCSCCINPHHSSLVIDSEQPPPPYSIVDAMPRAASYSSLTDSTTPSFLEDLSSSEESELLDSGIDDSSHSPPMHHQLPQEDSDSIGCTNLLFDESSMDQHSRQDLHSRQDQHPRQDHPRQDHPHQDHQRPPDDHPSPLPQSNLQPSHHPLQQCSPTQDPEEARDESSESSGSHYKPIIDASSSSSTCSSSSAALIPINNEQTPPPTATIHTASQERPHPAPTIHTASQERPHPAPIIHTTSQERPHPVMATTINQSCPIHGLHSSDASHQSRLRGPWCKMVYWEEKTRVGPFYEAQDDTVNVFEDLPQGTGFCLALLGASEGQSISKRIRVKIRYGLQLTREADGVWLYNRSNHVLFTWSPSLQLESQDPHMANSPPQVKRVPIGCSIKVFDRAQVHELTRQKLIDTTRMPTTSPTFKRFNIRVSFAKGWGQGYTRTYITQCPCWLEVFLNDQMVA